MGGNALPVQKQDNEMEEKIMQELATIKEYTLLSGKNVLTIGDVAMLTGLSKSRIYQLTCTQQIPHYKPRGKFVYFDRKEVEAWMLQNRVMTTEEAEQQAAAYIVGKGGRYAR